MPTAAKLVAGICFAIIGFLAALMFNATAETETGLGPSILTSAAIIGFLCGWVVLGRRPGLGGFESVASGIAAVIASLVFACILYGFSNFMSGLMHGAYASPMQALVSWLRVSVLLFVQTVTPSVWSILVLGGAIAGRLTGIANFRWS